MSMKFWARAGAILLFGAVIFSISGCEKEQVEQSTEPVKETKVEQAKQTPEQVPLPLKVKLETSKGDIIIELDEDKAPVTTQNFARYVKEGYYDGLIFHRVIANFMIQGGGFTADIQRKQTHEPIINEAANGLRNDRGTLAMARTNDPHSATSQFFINHKNNDFLNYVEGKTAGYAVFGKVVEGMDVVDIIAAVQTTERAGMKDVPKEPVVIKSATIVTEK